LGTKRTVLALKGTTNPLGALEAINRAFEVLREAKLSQRVLEGRL
jgi:hypothetical protein